MIFKECLGDHTPQNFRVTASNMVSTSNRPRGPSQHERAVLTSKLNFTVKYFSLKIKEKMRQGD